MENINVYVNPAVQENINVVVDYTDPDVTGAVSSATEAATLASSAAELANQAVGNVHVVIEQATSAIENANEAATAANTAANNANVPSYVKSISEDNIQQWNDPYRPFGGTWVKPTTVPGFIYYGPSATRPTTAADVKALSSSPTGVNGVTLATGANRFMTIAFPSGKALGNAFDNTSQEDVTSEYIPGTMTIDGQTYKVYTMELAIAYPSNHDHILTAINV